MQKGERDSIVRAEGLTKIFAVKGAKDVAALMIWIFACRKDSLRRWSGRMAREKQL